MQTRGAARVSSVLLMLGLLLLVTVSTLLFQWGAWLVGQQLRICDLPRSPVPGNKGAAQLQSVRC